MLASAPAFAAMDVSAYDDSPYSVISDVADSADNIFIELSPIYVPTIVVGGMVLKSRTKRPSKGSVKYIEKLEFVENTDTPTGDSTTVEPKVKSVKSRPSDRTSSSDIISSGSTIFSAIAESLPNNSKGGGSNG